MVRAKIITEKGQKLAQTHAAKIGFNIPKNRLAAELGRKPDTIAKWAKWAQRGCRDFARVQLEMWDRFPDKTPWHPFQVTILRDIDRIQYKGKNPKKNLTEDDIIAFVRGKNYSLKKFRDSLY